ncbi:MAG: ABC transporter, permease protein [Candidatus Woesebacteria bacterium GW2011_GWB1_38_8b]|uniref:ABC transporter, permease protein n=1 Tax=Candidatus Woesebacteria bacterium GW2011_GWB1_38_8b TaxID=1618571 RepID=A0A0G0L8H0_9BACT|nr:MAG: ABC transporter, permease protein [Candidatus Woesebacteria bacterium GW2011_GWB1_38_8b]
MEYQEIVEEAFATLSLNKLRTGLAMLGIIIGIGSVIALMALGQGSQKAVANQIQSLGANLLTISPASQRGGFVQGGAGSASTLTYADALAIENSSEIVNVERVSPEFSRRAQVTTGGKNTNTQIAGVTPNYSVVRKVEVSAGNFITDRDVSSQTKVAVLGPQVVSDLFGDNATPIGQSIRIQGQSFRVVGVTVSKGGSGFQNQDDVIYIPLTTAQKSLFGSTSLSSISVEAKSEDVMVAAQDEIGYLLLSRHKLSDPAISLIVGGIGIMNIMLVTVTERTREIGLRKALGAKKAVIITQFLVEAIILTLVGGLVGMVLGIGASYIIAKIISLPFAISLISIVLAVTVSGGIGIAFGFYPAKKASNLQPIEALRYE